MSRSVPHADGSPCPARPVLLALTPAEIADALSASRSVDQRAIVRLFDLEEFTDPGTAALVLADRMPGVSEAEAHDLAVTLTRPLRADAPRRGSGRPKRATDDAVDRLARTLLCRWPGPLVHLHLVVLWEQGSLNHIPLDRLRDVVREHGPRSASRAPALPGNRDTRSALDTVVIESIRTAAADPLDTISAAACGHAADELLALDPRRAGSWRIRGAAEGLGLCDPVAPPTIRRLRLAHLAGVLDGRLTVGDDTAIATVARRRSADLDDLLTDDANCHLVAPVLLALLPHEPAAVARVVALLTEPFPSWEQFVESVCATHPSDDPDHPDDPDDPDDTDDTDDTDDAEPNPSRTTVLVAIEAALGRWEVRHPSLRPAITRLKDEVARARGA